MPYPCKTNPEDKRLLFGKLREDYRLLDAGEGETFAALLPPAVQTADRDAVSLTETAPNICEGFGFRAEDAVRDCGDGLF